MTYYLVYRITNLVNGKIYVGAHQTPAINDRYLGSGIAIRRAIQKYGVENFRKEVLHVCENSTEMYAQEAVIVTKAFVADPNTYNLKLGGDGGFEHLTSFRFVKGNNGWAGRKHSSATRTRMGKPKSQDTRFKMSLAAKQHPNNFLGKTHTEESRLKMSIAAKARCLRAKEVNRA